MCPTQTLSIGESVLSNCLNAVPDALVLVDRHGRVVIANEVAASLLGWSPEELVGEELASLIPERFRDTHALHFTRYSGKRESRPEIIDLPLWASRKDGGEVPVRITLMPWDHGDSKLFVASLRDDTKRRHTEEVLRESELRFRLIAGHTADIIQQLDIEKDQIIHLGDCSKKTGFDQGGFPDTLSGWAELIHPDDRLRAVTEMDRVVNSGDKEWSIAYRILSPDGTYHHWLDHGTTIAWTEDGRSNIGVGAIQDVTQQVADKRTIEKSNAELEQALMEVLDLQERLAAENIYLQEEIKTTLDYEDIIGECENWKRVLKQIRLVAGSDTPVLVTGETGTGKELIARALHAESDRAERPLIKVNCAALPSTLIESELFGHVKGAFSGADAARIGRFELADGGTIFLDEIGEIPAELQAKLLHVLQNGEFERLGSSKTLKTDVRVIAASNRDLQEDMKKGLFRSDLYFRLAVFPIELPPLRERIEDISLLAAYFTSRHAARHAKSIKAIPQKAMRWLESYEWPGNVRELENMIERAVIVSPSETLQLDFVAVGEYGDDGETTSRPPERESSGSRGHRSRTLEEIERQHILTVLEESSWKVKGQGNAAERLGMKEGTLRGRMKKLGIKRPGR